MHSFKESGVQMAKSKRTKAVSIDIDTKARVAHRDTIRGYPCCINCGRPAPSDNPLAFSNAHYIPRSQGGLGVEENILTLCPRCHKEYDFGKGRAELRQKFKVYLILKYPDWNETKLIYRRTN